MLILGGFPCGIVVDSGIIMKLLTELRDFNQRAHTWPAIKLSARSLKNQRMNFYFSPFLYSLSFSLSLSLFLLLFFIFFSLILNSISISISIQFAVHFDWSCQTSDYVVRKHPQQCDYQEITHRWKPIFHLNCWLNFTVNYWNPILLGREGGRESREREGWFCDEMHCPKSLILTCGLTDHPPLWFLFRVILQHNGLKQRI